MPLLSRLRAFYRGGPSVSGGYPAAQPLPRPPPLPQLKARDSPAPDMGDVYPSQRYARLAQERISSLPPPYRWLDPEDVKLIGEHPVAAGGFANVYEATHDGRKVMLKSYRPYMSFDIARVVAVCCNDSLRLYRVFR